MEKYKINDLFLSVRDVDLAATLGVSVSTVNRWRRGISQPSPLAKQALERLLKSMEEKDESD